MPPAVDEDAEYSPSVAPPDEVMVPMPDEKPDEALSTQTRTLIALARQRDKEVAWQEIPREREAAVCGG